MGAVPSGFVITFFVLRCLLVRATVLSLLAIVPFPSNNSNDGWSQGLELVPAGLLALKHINGTPGLLEGHTLELVVREGESCGATVIVKDIYSFYQEYRRGSAGRNLVGVVGLPCSTATGAFSKIAGHPGVDLVQISGSTSPALSDSVSYPRLYRVASSVGIVDSIVSFMKAAKWSRVSVYHDEQGLYFKTIAQLFTSAVRNDTAMTLDNVEGLTSLTDESVVERILSAPNVKRNKITVIIGTEYQCSVFICAAYRLGRRWPGYVFIVPEKDVADFKATLLCDAQTMTEAIEGVFTVNVASSAADSSVLVSGRTYADYRLEYLQELKAFASKTGYRLDANGSAYANNLYDGVWSFALALNSSSQVLTAMNLSFDNFSSYPNQISNSLEEALRKMDFQGAGGRINFKNNRQPITSLSLRQIINGRSQLAAEYNGSLTVSGDFSLVHLPSDNIDRIFIYDPVWLIVTNSFICALCLILLGINAAVLIGYRNRRDIKATSPSLSLLMFVGCILLVISVPTLTFTNQFDLSGTAFLVLCNAETWLLSLGTNLIINTLFVRLFRVYRLFRPNNYKKGGKVWRDESLFFIILLLTVYSVIVLLMWAIFDPYQKREEELYHGSATPPHFEVRSFCSCQFEALWLGVLFLYPAVLTLGVVLLAVMTRHVSRQNFKDTKKVNICIFTSIAAVVTLLPLWWLLDAIGLYSWAHLAFSAAILFVPMACQVFLYVPKTFPYLCCCCVQTLSSRNTITASQSSISSAHHLQLTHF